MSQRPHPSYLEHSAQVILLRAHDQSRAFKMFETLNDRGLRTSQADLVKSYLFGLAEKQVGLAQSKWSNMLENLQDLGDDDPQVSFLRHYLIAFSGFVRADGVYDAPCVREVVRCSTFPLFLRWAG